LKEFRFGFGLRGTEEAEKGTAGGSKCGRGSTACGKRPLWEQDRLKAYLSG